MTDRKELVKTWKRIYSPFHFRFLTIAPLSKEGYPHTPVWDAFSYGANIAVQADGMRHVTLDIDTHRLTPFVRKVMKQTLSWKTPKGYGMAFDGPVATNYRDAFFALRYVDLILWDKVNEKDFALGRRIRERLVAQGITDKTAVHGIFRHLDGLSYVLVPPSVSCRYQGKSRDGKVQRVREHSSQIKFCNNSPDGKHHYVMREFVNYTLRLMKFNRFMEQLLNAKL